MSSLGFGHGGDARDLAGQRPIGDKAEMPHRDERPSLAERLGYGPEDRLLIVHCDDLGSSHSANVASYRSIVYGVATSATLMVPCPWAREAARMLHGLSVG